MYDSVLNSLSTQALPFVDDAGMDLWIERLRKLSRIHISHIGKSRAGRAMYGLRIGSGHKVATITAGAHADEPAGPLTAMLMAELLGRADGPVTKCLTDQYTWLICPQVNPDGAQANSTWFAPVPEFLTYVKNVKRELPGDDVEFGYPGAGQQALRPENQAVADFLATAPPAHMHASLHSMGFAAGAWFLLGGPAADNPDLQARLVEAAGEEGFGLHDVQRNGEKGFRRIAKGFCTTPDSRAMAQFFIDRGDPAMAAMFRFSSMEWSAARSRDVNLLVTEIPNFAIGGGYQLQARADLQPEPQTDPSPVPGETPYEKFRDVLRALIAQEDYPSAVALAERYNLTPVPFTAQCRLMLKAVITLAMQGSEVQ